MKPTRSREWFYVSAQFVGGILVFSTLYVFATLFIPPATDVRDYYAGVVDFVEEANFQEPAAVHAAAPGASGFPEMLALKLHEKEREGGLILVYRGLETGGRFRLDVTLPQMDARAVYARVFEISEARNGFNVADRRFTLVSARETFLHLKLSD
jgi:hypothetical protein